MPIELVNPDGLPKPTLYRQMAIATGSRTLYLSGQVARDAENRHVGTGDLAAQVEQAYLNVATAVASAGGSFADVARLTLYFVDWRPEKLQALGEGVSRAAAKLGQDLTKPVTLLSVAALSEPDLLVEIEAIAVLP
jgi:enamine deaminase RidA (YjgF/YER057c/UK114 family)